MVGMKNPASHDSPWDEFVHRAKEYVHTGQLDDQEVSYKLRIGEALAVAREAVLADKEDWADALKKGVNNFNVLDWRTRDAHRSRCWWKRW